MKDFAQYIGHKVDVVGADACLMAMIEVAGELASSTDFFVASQDLEPGDGWPYDELLTDWNALDRAKASDVSTSLSHGFSAEHLQRFRDIVVGRAEAVAKSVIVVS